MHFECVLMWTKNQKTNKVNTHSHVCMHPTVNNNNLKSVILKGNSDHLRMNKIHKQWFIWISEAQAEVLRLKESFACQSCESEARVSHALGAQRSTTDPKKDLHHFWCQWGAPFLKHALNQHMRDKEHSRGGIFSDTELFKRERKCLSMLLSRALHPHCVMGLRLTIPHTSSDARV